MKRTSFLAFALAAALVLAGCPKGGGGPLAIFKPKMTTHTSLSLNLKFAYPADVLTLRDQLEGEYPIALDGKGYTILIKRIAGAGALLSKAPEVPLYDFVATNNAKAFLRFFKYKVADEKRELVPCAKNTFYAQYLTFDVSKDKLPAYVPDTARPPQGASATTLYARYYYTLTLQDLYIVHVVSTQPLSRDADSIMRNILATFEFGAVK